MAFTIGGYSGPILEELYAVPDIAPPITVIADFIAIHWTAMTFIAAYLWVPVMDRNRLIFDLRICRKYKMN
jgi:hypothetical protein